MPGLRLKLELGQDLPDREVVEAALLYLMTRYSARPCLGLARGIVQQLDLLVSHPALAASAPDPGFYVNLLRDWRFIAAECQAQQAGHGRAEPDRH